MSVYVPPTKMMPVGIVENLGVVGAPFVGQSDFYHYRYPLITGWLTTEGAGAGGIIGEWVWYPSEAERTRIMGHGYPFGYVCASPSRMNLSFAAPSTFPYNTGQLVFSHLQVNDDLTFDILEQLEVAEFPQNPLQQVSVDLPLPANPDIGIFQLTATINGFQWQGELTGGEGELLGYSAVGVRSINPEVIT